MIIDKSSSGISAMIFVNSIAMFISPRVMNGQKLSMSNCMIEHWVLTL